MIIKMQNLQIHNISRNIYDFLFFSLGTDGL